MIQRCKDCTCWEFEGSQKNPEKCVCGHPRESHTTIELPKEIKPFVRAILTDLSGHKGRLKMALEQIDRDISNLCRLLDGD